jgi:hypothetical protein
MRVTTAGASTEGPTSLAECLKWLRDAATQFRDRVTRHAAFKPKTTFVRWKAWFYSFKFFSTTRKKEKLSYTRLNTVRARLVTMPAQSRWSFERWRIERRMGGNSHCMGGLTQGMGLLDDRLM